MNDKPNTDNPESKSFLPAAARGLAPCENSERRMVRDEALTFLQSLNSFLDESCLDSEIDADEDRMMNLVREKELAERERCAVKVESLKGTFPQNREVMDEAFEFAAQQIRSGR